MHKEAVGEVFYIGMVGFRGPQDQQEGKYVGLIRRIRFEFYHDLCFSSSLLPNYLGALVFGAEACGSIVEKEMRL